MIVGEPTALLVTVIFPETLPAPVGLYAAVTVALVPGARLAGSVTPEIPTPATEGVAASVEDVAVALIPITMLASVALLVIETVPVSVPGETGLYVTVKFTVCPLARLIGTVNPETLTPVPENAILDIVAASLPVFSR